MIDRRRFLSLAALATTAAGSAPPGRIETLPKLGLAPSTEPRIRVWLPPGYAKSGHRYATLYLLDRQYAFAGDSGGVNFARMSPNWPIYDERMTTRGCRRCGGAISRSSAARRGGGCGSIMGRR